ncbi:MAG: phosphate ABC transporter substrate-binding protein PstS [Ilumatobacter sp.]|uniref:phosphate ABC transporter substrate-binding protein PstS n=1 Tax=Ilumatobacter sp. TaxID=1967498 RepID=UPI003C78788E
MNSKRRIFAGAIALTLTAAACGGSDEDTGTEVTDEEAAPEEAGETTDGESEAAEAGAPVAGTLIGAGASSQAAAMLGWQVGFQELNPDAVVEYDPIGSGGGRETFLAGGTVFAGSDAYLKDDEFEASKERCAGDGGAINLPHYISPIAIPFNLDGVDSLNLSPELIGGIFANTVENWNDPAIAELNPDTELPDLAINPVHRSDESGTTENFTDYLSQAAPDEWSFGAIELWDDDGPGGGEAGQGTSGVVASVGAGNGSIGYADASQIGDLPAAAVGVAGDFVEFSPEAAARIVDASERLGGRNDFDFAIEVNRTPDDATVYPIALISYHVVCLQYETQEEVDLVTAFMRYVGSEAGQADAAAAAGSAPISEEVRAEILTSLDQITVAG